MGRWQPDARGRLAIAAFELYAEQGYERTTGAEIAARAGMHERSFFRLFGDKREVPFHGMADVAVRFADVITAASDGMTAIDLARLAVEDQCSSMQQSPAHMKLRHDVIASSPDLRERDLAKHADLAQAVADALGRRGIPPTTARLAAEASMVALRVSVDAWLSAQGRGDLVVLYRETLSALGEVLTETTSPG